MVVFSGIFGLIGAKSPCCEWFGFVVESVTMTDRPQDAGAPEIEVTPDMIEAGIHAYFANTSEDWCAPGGDELRRMMRTIFLAMWSQRYST
jgi:hypothetical protein